MITVVDSSFRSKQVCDIVFKLNSDDYGTIHIRKITKYVKDVLGLKIHKTRVYSKTKCMSWCYVRIETLNTVSWAQNDELALGILNSALFSNEK